MAIPTLPGVPQASGFLNVGPDGISAGFDLALDMCNARPIMVYVTQQKGAPADGGGSWPPVQPPPAGMPAPPPPPPAPISRPPTPGAQKGGQIWRLIDPLAAIEKLPVFKEWSEEKTYPNGHWKPVYRQPEPPKKPEQPKPNPPVVICTEIFTLGDSVERSYFKFDEPGRKITSLSSFPTAFNDINDVNADIERTATAISADAQREGGGTIPLSQTPFERKFIFFGHADMCAPFHYNFGLSFRRNAALAMAISKHPRGNELWNAQLNTGKSGGYPACSDFNPTSGPNDHERAAENSSNGTANRPATQAFDGNPPNRRIELFVIPDYKPSSGKPSKIKEIISNARSALMAECGISPADWPDGEFPCPAGKLVTSASDDATVRVCHALSSAQPPPHKGPGDGPGYRQCRFYQMFTDGVRNLRLTDEVCEVQPQPQPRPQPEPEPNQPVFDHWEWVEDAPVTEKQGEYHPPRGEHYSYYMDEMVKEGVNARDVFPPAVAVAPNDRVNPDNFNLIKAGSVRVVKLDIGFWGDERTNEPNRKGGFRRVPKRYFGLIEGQFVFNCVFETPETRGFTRPCSEGFDQDLTPLCFQLDQAVRQAGFKILIMAKAVAEDGPDKQRLKIFFPDMHLPRKFDDKDPEYSSVECVRRVQTVKSMVLHQLKRDYRLPAAMTPWLTTLDRRMLRDFFEGGSPRLKLPHFYLLGGPKFISRRTNSNDGVLAQAADVARNAFNFIMQVGYRMFAFTQEDYRRMVRVYPQNFPEKGYGRTKDILFNWFYGFTTDRNTQPPTESPLERTAKNLVPELVQEVLDTHAGTKLGPNEGRAPAQENLTTVEAGPARDLLRFLRVIRQAQRGQPAQNGQPAAPPIPIDVFHTGDLYELWVNRRFLFEDFHETDDPVAQLTEATAGLTSPTSANNPLGKIGAAAGDAMKFLIASFAKIVLGGLNATDHDLWWRRETNKAAANTQMDPDTQSLQPERGITITKFDPQLHLPRFTSPTPGTLGGGMTGPPGGGQLSADGLNYREDRLGWRQSDDTYNPFPASTDRGRGYLTNETQRRINQVEAFEAPIRTDPNGAAEDRALLGGNITGRNRDSGLWNKAIVDAFRGLNATFIYGNHDCFRGVPRDRGLSLALPYHSEPGLWVEHGHRFEDSNIDGQPFGAFVTNLCYEIQELPFSEGVLDEYLLHREQSQYQPGLIQWFLLVQFGGPDFLKRFQRQNENVAAIHPFRITVNSHTHAPDLVVAQIIFKDREVAKIDVPLLGSVSVESLVNMGGAALKAVLLWKKFEEWYEKWKDRSGFEKWWEDIKGNTINWGVDFAGLAKCADKAIDFIKKQGENTKDKLKKEWDESSGSFKRMVDQNARTLGR